MDTESRPRILDVDADDARRGATKKLFEGAGLSVLDAACALDAIAVMRAEHPDAVVLDTALPDVDGFDLCRRVRADSSIAATPLVCTSTDLADAAQRVRALVAGADACLARPVDARELVATLHAVMRRAHVKAIVPEAAGAQSRRVLIVEDNDDALWALRLLCESWGHRVIVASDGMNGLALALAEPPDVALVDVGLPVLDGYEVARRIRAATLERPPLLVALTGYGAPDDRETALRAGFDVHLVKPVSPETLARLLQVTTSNGHEWSANRSASNGKSVFERARSDRLDLLWT